MARNNEFKIKKNQISKDKMTREAKEVWRDLFQETNEETNRQKAGSESIKQPNNKPTARSAWLNVGRN